MAEAVRDQNFVTVALGESNTTPGLTLPFKIDEITGRLLVDSTGGSMSIGGAITGGTEGSVLFVGAGSVLAQDNADLFWLAASDALQLGSGSSLELYNTADKTTNYERLRVSWAANRAELGTFFAGTGTPRQLRVGAGTASTLSSYLGFYSQQFPFLDITLPNTASSGVLSELFKGSFTGSAGTQTIASIQPTINQSGTAGYTVLDINPTETATGSGTKLLQRWAIGGTSVANMDRVGAFYSNYIAGVVNIGLSSAINGAIDVTLARDAADTLALRRSTAAQTFRVYNTYTDGSNYERGIIMWNSNNFDIFPQSAGTGTGRNMRLYTANTNDLVFGTNGLMRWIVNSSGHFLSNADNSYDIGASGANRPRSLYLGTSLFMPSAGVINWNAGDVTLTHASNLLTLAGGQWTFGANTAYFTQTDNGNSSTADTIDWTLSNKQKSTLTGNCTFTFTAPGGPASLVLECINDGTVRTITWPATVKWSGGTAPTFTGTSGKSDIITFFYNGTVYYGNYTLNFVNS